MGCWIGYVENRERPLCAIAKTNWHPPTIVCKLAELQTDHQVPEMRKYGKPTKTADMTQRSLKRMITIARVASGATDWSKFCFEVMHGFREKIPPAPFARL